MIIFLYFLKGAGLTITVIEMARIARLSRGLPKGICPLSKIAHGSIRFGTVWQRVRQVAENVQNAAFRGHGKFAVVSEAGIYLIGDLSAITVKTRFLVSY